MATARRELVGYASRLEVVPGETLEFMVSSEFPEYRASIVRLIHGDRNPAGPGAREVPIDTPVTGTYEGRRQRTYPGSFVHVPNSASLGERSSFTLQAWIQPTTPDAGRVQGIMGTRSADHYAGFGLVIDESGALALDVRSEGAVGTVSTGVPLRAGAWYFVAGSFDAANGLARVESHLLPRWPLADASATAERRLDSGVSPSNAPFVIGAASVAEVDGRLVAEGHFNGRVDSPRVFDRALAAEEAQRLREGAGDVAGDAVVAAWDFAADHGSSTRVTDRGPHGLHGTTVNHPTRAVTGHRWDGSVFDPSDAQEHYGAIHFHDDDLVDAGWDVSFSLPVPTDLRSGVYAAKLEAEGGHEDYVPFFVRPPRGQATAPIAFLAPTNTYLAYANESVLLRDDVDFSTMTNIPIEADPYDLLLKEHPEYSASLYDLHSDGSGIDYSSSLRPILSMRPVHRHWVLAGPRHLPSDLYLIDWLEHKGLDFDVITDEDLDAEGKDLLDRYQVVLTGSHPEYWTEPALDGLQAYLDGGGHLMYLGGNGFYWVTAFDPERREVIEVRRGYAGTRAWESHPGELHLASTGELGGLWRHRGRSPNSLCGVGFAGQGWDVNSPGYRRLPDSFDERAKFIFEGIAADETIGDFGLVMNGAAGDEVDRHDPKLGTPPHALRLATSEGGHSDYYLVCHEDQLVTMKEIHGTDNPQLRSDLVYFETPEGGAVFSVGSMTWLASLSHNGYDNNVSRITENVLRRFLDS